MAGRIHTMAFVLPPDPGPCTSESSIRGLSKDTWIHASCTSVSLSLSYPSVFLPSSVVSRRFLPTLQRVLLESFKHLDAALLNPSLGPR
jgi:hypothetical protein